MKRPLIPEALGDIRYESARQMSIARALSFFKWCRPSRFEQMASSVLVLALIVNTPHSLAAETDYRVVFENDLFGGTDRYFTNAIRFDAIRPAGELPAWVSRLPVIGSRAGKENRGSNASVPQMTYMLGQNMYSSSDVTNPNPPLTDRPWAGWLYVAALISRNFTDGANSQFAEALQINVGITGPPSLAGPTQTWIHEDISPQSPTPKGWHTQMPAEPTVDVMYELRWRAWATDSSSPLGVDFFPSAAVHIGTLFDQVRTGGMLRAGWNLTPIPGPSQIHTTNAIALKSISDENRAAVLQSLRLAPVQPRWSAFLVTGFNLRAVLRNGFLDGPLFRSGGRSVTKEPLVLETFTGASLKLRRVELSYLLITRSAEFKTQVGTQTYGSLQLGTSW